MISIASKGSVTMDFSILDKRERPKSDAPRAAFYQDLNLDRIIRQIEISYGEAVGKYYLYFPMDKECEDYRREIWHDIKRQEISGALYDFREQIQGMNEALKVKEQVINDLQKQVWHLHAIHAYSDAFEALYAGIKNAELTSEGMAGFRNYLGEYLRNAEYLEMKGRVSEVLDQLKSLRFTLTYDKERMVIAEGPAECVYEEFLAGHGNAPKERKRSPFGISPMIGAFELQCLTIIQQKKPKLFRHLQEVSRRYDSYGDDVLLRFIREVSFYMSFHSFERDMKKRGFHFSEPATDSSAPMKADGLYDLALACASLADGREVISNDMNYGSDESFFVVTGPNQGGKTTFARSLGQLVFFTKLGLDVPADFANVHYFRDILSHFSVEESVETGRGKLKEELVRLAPMMEESCENMFVVINELFTTAATYDAEIMGKRVLDHFIGLKCRGIYVTHLKELATAHEKVVSLCAMLSPEKVQTFKIERSNAQESACAFNQVNKYRLTYEQLKERL